MVQPEASSHQDVEITITRVADALRVLSLVFDTNDQDRTLDCGQCDGMRLLFDALKDKLHDAADAASVMEVNLRLAKKSAEPMNAAYQEVWKFGTEFGAACVKNGEDHRQHAPDFIRKYFQGWTGDQPPVADQPVYPQVHPAPQAEEPDALSA